MRTKDEWFDRKAESFWYKIIYPACAACCDNCQSVIEANRQVVVDALAEELHETYEWGWDEAY